MGNLLDGPRHKLDGLKRHRVKLLRLSMGGSRPLSDADAISKVSNLVISVNMSGRPFIKLFWLYWPSPTQRCRRLMRFARVNGSSPSNSFPARFSDSILARVPRQRGIGPVKEFDAIEISSILRISQMPVGIFPNILLSLTEKWTRPSGNLCGNWPSILFFDISKYSSLRNFPNPGVISPERKLSCRSRFTNC